MNVDRSVSTEGRLIHDMRMPNLASDKCEHPPALQARHRSLARLALWWRARHPRIQLLCAKVDVSRAFKWLRIHPADVGDFGCSLPGAPVGLVYALALTVPFGWCGAPGEYMAFVWVPRIGWRHGRRRDPSGMMKCASLRAG